MGDIVRDRTDLDRLIRLIGMLGDPREPGFWDSWRKDLNGYSFKKMKNGIHWCTQAETEAMRVHDFTDYVLMFFSTDSEAEEKKLVDSVARTISSHGEQESGRQFLRDLRETAWRLYLDHDSVEVATVMSNWDKAVK